MLVQAFLVWGGLYGETRLDSIDDKRKCCQTNHWLCSAYIHWVSFSTTLRLEYNFHEI